MLRGHNVFRIQNGPFFAVLTVSFPSISDVTESESDELHNRKDLYAGGALHRKDNVQMLEHCSQPSA